ncbi:hypothetical protein AX16_005937 [Volvariella volvacea WC 439]|nr:hypothetical protein AX16_005937 [Volvariella volvacea WC 439]
MTTQSIAADWLSSFADGVAAGDVKRLANLFVSNGWLRDFLVFSWNNRSLEGREKIADYLDQNLKNAGVTDVQLEQRPGLTPEFRDFVIAKGISAGFSFNTQIAFGHGFFNLVQGEDGEWRALTVLMAVKDLKVAPESGMEWGTYGGHTLAWSDISSERQHKVEDDPHVVVVGGSQSGLNIASRLKQMSIPTLLIERNPRIGDTWRNRYPTLSLHTTRSHHTMLYQPYPKNWPIYTPRDKLADWLEQYSKSQDLVVWTNATLLPGSTYDHNTKPHIVCATGTLGAPLVPKVLNEKVFRGEVFHASKYQGAHPYTGKKVVVIGAGNTSADICQDMVFHDAAEVTMVQRSKTVVVTSRTTHKMLNIFWPEGVPAEISDLKFASFPMILIKKWAKEALKTKQGYEEEVEIHKKLRKAGLDVNLGEEQGGFFLMAFERLGGYWFDVGCAELIYNGKVNIKQGVEPKEFVEDGIIFSDGSKLEADVVIYATGYRWIRDHMKDLFGEGVINQTGRVCGLDKEGEIHGSYRPSGHPGLWFGAGDFFCSRYLSKNLALYIKAIQLGLMKA